MDFTMGTYPNSIYFKSTMERLEQCEKYVQSHQLRADYVKIFIPSYTTVYWIERNCDYMKNFNPDRK